MLYLLILASTHILTLVVFSRISDYPDLSSEERAGLFVAWLFLSPFIVVGVLLGLVSLAYAKIRERLTRRAQELDIDVTVDLSRLETHESQS